MKLPTLAAAAFLASVIPGASLGADLIVSGARVATQIPGTFNASLSVAGPNDFYMRAFSPSGGVALQLASESRLADGAYRWEVRAATPRFVRKRDKQTDRFVQVRETVVRFGTFTVKNGAIHLPDESAREE